MTLKAVLFDFNGVIINDEPLHAKLVEQILLEENLILKPGEFKQYGLGRSDRACFTDLFNLRGRILSESLLASLIQRKADAYFKQLAELEKLPIYPGLEDFIFKVRAANFKLAIVSGALRSEIDWILQRSNLQTGFSVIVAGDDITTSKPDPTGYLLAVDRLNQEFPDLHLRASDCLVIEDTFAGIQAAKNAQMPVVGVANTYPFHMMQRHANWAVDYLSDIEFDRLQDLYANQTAA
ncbi:HAD family hydrolase [Alkalinema pantanalense CENA528]|uniref:HAD family hydrolase n=1 Tax=Alkalinema pantanalense TaxID=1620705 RepID=UPI003D6E796B